MDNSFHEQGSNTNQDRKRFLVSLPILGNLIKWLASLIQLTELIQLTTEEEQEVAGIYLGRLGGE